MVFAVPRRLKTGLSALPISPFPSLSLWLSDHSFAVICSFSPDAKTEAILEATVGFHQWQRRISKTGEVKKIENQEMTKERSEGLVSFVLSFIASGLGDRGKLLWTVVYTIWFPCLVSDTNSTERDGWIWRYISACVFSFSVLTYQFVQ